MKYEVGDVVLDSWGLGSPSKATVINVKKSLFGNKYYTRTNYGGYESVYPRKGSDLQLLEKKPEVIEETPQKKFDTEELIRLQSKQLENQRRIAEQMEQLKQVRKAMEMKTPSLGPWGTEGDWFDVETTTQLGKNVEAGTIGRARVKSDGNYRVVIGNHEYNLSPNIFHRAFEKYDINDYATEYPRKKEEKKVGGELYGYPPEEDTVPHSEIAKLHDIAAKKINAAEAKVAELERQLEVSRRQKVAEEYGIVAERHLWDVVVDVPMSWVGKRIPGGGERSTEVITEGQNMVEAAMAAEAMAKGINENAYVVKITYNRILGAVR